MDVHTVLLALHVAAGTIGLLVGAKLIWLTRDRVPERVPSVAYQWSVLAVSLSASALLALDWPDLWWLLLLAGLAYALALAGHMAARRRFRGWEAAYAHGVGGSFIALVTALLVVALTVDGPIKGLAAIGVWVLPTLVGTVLIRRWHHRLLCRERDARHRHDASSRRLGDRRLLWR